MTIEDDKMVVADLSDWHWGQPESLEQLSRSIAENGAKVMLNEIVQNASLMLSSYPKDSDPMVLVFSDVEFHKPGSDLVDTCIYKESLCDLIRAHAEMEDPDELENTLECLELLIKELRSRS